MSEPSLGSLLEENEQLRMRVAALESNHCADRETTIFNALLENAPDYILVLDPDGTIRYLNRTGPEYELDEVIGANSYDFVQPAYRSTVAEYIQEVLETGEVRQFEIPAVEKSRTTWYGVRMGPYKENGEVIGVTVFATDVSSRVSAERTREEIERRLDTLCSISPVGIMRFDTAGRCVYLNLRVCEIFRRRTQNLLGEKWLNCVHEDDRSPALQQWREQSDGEAAFQTEFRLMMPDNSIRWAYWQSIAEKSFDGNVTGYVAMVTDITSRKDYEVSLEAEQRLLRKLLALQERERQLIVHDIHDGFVQDVVGAKMMLEAAAAQLGPLDDEQQQSVDRSVHLMGEAIAEARRMISDLRPLIIDEQGVIEAVNHLVHDERFCQGISIQYDYDDDLERFDPMLEGVVFRIVQEALTNVVRHSQAKEANVSLRRSNGDLRVEISDRGVGFDKKKIPKDRFGLRGIEERARLFGGSARIITSPGQGTKVAVTIPRDGSLPE